MGMSRLGGGGMGARLQVTFWRRPYFVVAAGGLLRAGGSGRAGRRLALKPRELRGEKELGQKGINSREEIDVDGRLMSRSGRATSPTSRASSLLYRKILGASRARAWLEFYRAYTSRATSRRGSARFHP
jgi:hypothetical protein